ncbi:hypothetical protein GCM10020370_31650 [Paenibacillus hodogayensis]
MFAGELAPQALNSVADSTAAAIMAVILLNSFIGFFCPFIVTMRISFNYEVYLILSPLNMDNCAYFLWIMMA